MNLPCGCGSQIWWETERQAKTEPVAVPLGALARSARSLPVPKHPYAFFASIEKNEWHILNVISTILITSLILKTKIKKITLNKGQLLCPADAVKMKTEVSRIPFGSTTYFSR